MIELPEAKNIAGQLNKTISGKRIAGVTAAHTPHKLAWYYGDRAKYPSLLSAGRSAEPAPSAAWSRSPSRWRELLVGRRSDVRFHAKSEPRPPRHQLLIIRRRSSLTPAVQDAWRDGSLPRGLSWTIAFTRLPKRNRHRSRGLRPRLFRSADLRARSFRSFQLKAAAGDPAGRSGLGNGVLRGHPVRGRNPRRGEGRHAGRRDDAVLFSAAKKDPGRDDGAGEAGMYEWISLAGPAAMRPYSQTLQRALSESTVP